MTTLTAALYWLNLALLSAMLVLSIYGTRQWWHGFRGAFVPPLLYSLSGIALFAMLLSGLMRPESARLWGSVHVTIGTACILGIVIMLVVDDG